MKTLYYWNDDLLDLEISLKECAYIDNIDGFNIVYSYQLNTFLVYPEFESPCIYFQEMSFTTENQKAVYSWLVDFLEKLEYEESKKLENELLQKIELEKRSLENDLFLRDINYYLNRI